jgi:hypothetical protein
MKIIQISSIHLIMLCGGFFIAGLVTAAVLLWENIIEIVDIDDKDRID